MDTKNINNPNGGFPPLYKKDQILNTNIQRNFALPKGDILSINDLYKQLYSEKKDT